MVTEGLQEDMGEASMLCTNHPYKNNTPGGICAFCLQEKLGKLVSSSFPIAVFPSSSSSSSPSVRSEFGIVTTNSTLPNHKTPSSSNTHMTHHTHHANEVRNTINISISNSSSNNEYQCHQYYSRRSRIMFLLNQKKKKKDLSTSDHNSIVFKRSKSTTTPRRGLHFMDAENVDDLSPQKRGFWSFLYLPNKHSAANRKTLGDISSNSMVAHLVVSLSRTNDKETPHHGKSETFITSTERYGLGEEIQSRWRSL